MGEQLEIRTKELGRGPSVVLAAAMFVTGGCGLVAQYVLSTVSTYILGNSIEQFSVVIALMLLMMGLAGVAQNFVSDRLLVEKFVLTEILLGLLCGFAPSALYAAYAVAEDHFPLVQYSLVVAVGFLIGIEIPLAIRINGKYARTLKGNIASIWSLDYIGSFVGALIWAFWLIKVLPLTQLSFLVGGLNLLVAGGTLAYFWRIGSVERRFPVVAALVLAIGATVYGFGRSPDWSRAIDQRLYEDPIVHSETTKYQRIVVTHGAAIDDLRLYLNGNLQFSSVDERIYHEQLVHPAMGLAPRRSRVLVLGGGDGLALREILKYPDVWEVVLVDLDPDMIRLAKSLPALVRLNGNSFGDARVSSVLPEGMRTVGRRQVVMETGAGSPRRPEVQTVGKVRVFTLDADRFLSRATGLWDVIVVDLPDPNSIELAKLYSLEFYRKLRRSLSPDGVTVVQATSPFHAKETFLCIRRTMEAAGLRTLPYHDNVPSFGDWGWILGNVDGQWKGRQAIEVPTDYLTTELVARSRAFGRDWLTSRHSDVSTLMHPVVLQRYLDAGWKVE